MGFCRRMVVLQVLACLGCFAPNQSQAQQAIIPKEHFMLDNPAELTPEAAEQVYRELRGEMVAIYRGSDLEQLARYKSWPRLNRYPYLSATHGQRYINNYANERAAGYADFEQAAILPEGAVLAKDSFTATDDGRIFVGPLFLMEKMAAGFRSDARDWRYLMVLPDGSLFGDSASDPDKTMNFCIECHRAAGDEQDHLFFIPAEIRVSD